LTIGYDLPDHRTAILIDSISFDVYRRGRPIARGSQFNDYIYVSSS